MAPALEQLRQLSTEGCIDAFVLFQPASEMVVLNRLREWCRIVVVLWRFVDREAVLISRFESGLGCGRLRDEFTRLSLEDGGREFPDQRMLFSSVQHSGQPM